MIGMDRQTGRPLGSWDHVVQSIGDILSTRVGTRVQRRPYGSDVPGLIDRPQNRQTLLDTFVAVAEALDAWEPRVALRGIEVQAAGPDGGMTLALDMIWSETGEARSAEVAL